MPRPVARRAIATAALATAGLGLLGACGSNGSSSSTTTPSPEAVRAPMSVVVTELPKMVVLGNKAAADGQVGAFDAAKTETGLIEDVWKTVEGTVKATDIDTYERIETAQGLINDGATHHNLARMEQGAADQAAVVAQFVAAHK